MGDDELIKFVGVMCASGEAEAFRFRADRGGEGGLRSKAQGTGDGRGSARAEVCSNE